MYKILIGIPAMFPPKDLVNEKGLIVNKEVDEEWGIWCDFEVTQSENYYELGFETMLGFKTEDGCRSWIQYCLDVFTEYMEEHGYDTSKELGMYEAFTTGYNVNTKFKSIEETYAWLKMIVYGFHGQALSC